VKIELKPNVVMSFGHGEKTIKVLGPQVEYGADLSGELREGVIKRGGKKKFTDPIMLRSRHGSEIELIVPEAITSEPIEAPA